jgi:hypothetical protein
MRLAKAVLRRHAAELDRQIDRLIESIEIRGGSTCRLCDRLIDLVLALDEAIRYCDRELDS